MAKTRSKKVRRVFLCRECGSTQTQWMGKCPDCGAWDSLAPFTDKPAEPDPQRGVVEVWANPEGGDADGVVAASVARPLPEVETEDVERWPTGIGELDRVLGGGFVPGSVVLVGGDPGIGKSTLLLQAAATIARSGRPVLYASSEESAFQTRLRAERLFGEGLDGLDALYILADTNLGRIVEQARQIRPAILILDSIQMVYKADLDATPGSVSQIRRCCTELVYLAKMSGMAVAMIGHVTKDGQLAGPKLLEHLVDGVFSFEGDRHHAHRVVRAVKNRFGTTLEVGLFEMTGAGLGEVTDLSRWVESNSAGRPGSVAVPALHGTRSIIVEVQALTATGFLGSAKRRASGLDANRLALIVAILEQHGDMRLADQDVFASVAGGWKIAEPAADLAVALAIAGAFLRRSLPAGTAVLGEVGLGGEIRGVDHLEQRCREASRLGFKRLVVGPNVSVPDGAPEVVRVAGIRDAIELLDVVSTA